MTQSTNTCTAVTTTTTSSPSSSCIMDNVHENPTEIIEMTRNQDNHNNNNTTVVASSSSSITKEDSSSLSSSFPFYHNLVILPPLQKCSEDRQQVLQDAILLPPIQATEPVASIRTALLDIRGYAHMTQYQFMVEQDDTFSRDLVLLLQQQQKESLLVEEESPLSSSISSTYGKNKNPTTKASTTTTTTSSSVHNNHSIITTTNKNHNGNKKDSKEKNTTINNKQNDNNNNCQQKNESKKKNHSKKKKNHNKNPSSSSHGVVNTFLLDTLVNTKGLISPYTTHTAVIQSSFSSSCQEDTTTTTTTITQKKKNTPSKAIYFNDYEDLTTLAFQNILQSNQTCLRIVLQKYDLASMKDHVERLKLLILGGSYNNNYYGNYHHHYHIPIMTQLYTPPPPPPTSSKDTSTTTITTTTKNNTAIVDDTPSDGTNPTTTTTTVDGSTTIKVEEEEEGISATVNLSNTTSTNQHLPTISMDESIVISGTDLNHYFYLAFGEHEWMKYKMNKTTGNSSSSSSSSSMNNTNEKSLTKQQEEEEEKENLKFQTFQKQVQQRILLDSACQIPSTVITYSGYNPPSSQRRLLGDLAYLEIILPHQVQIMENEEEEEEEEEDYDDKKKKNHQISLLYTHFQVIGSIRVNVTATISGFYINRTTTSTSAAVNHHSCLDTNFDPRPADESCFSHTLLDCLLLYSKPLRICWARTLSAATERSTLLAEMSLQENAFQGLFRSVIRSDFYSPKFVVDPLKFVPERLCGEHFVDSIFIRPSWIVPALSPECHGMEKQAHNIGRSNDYFNNSYGIDFRNSPLRDWNEELQSARDLPKETLQERIDRAKLIHKVLSDFADASVSGAMAIFEGHLIPMNPNEPTRSHVYLHNNIFFSRAVDSGLDTFKVAQGDACARKVANRDLNCVQNLHQLDVLGINTLATVLIDYLGTRIVCQSIVPGILYGEKNHTIVYGAVEASSSIAWNEEFHQKIVENLGKTMMVASRPLSLYPLLADRKGTAEYSPSSSVMMCGPVEMKGIRGSDQRTYCLDITRLTPRDANWVPQGDGGTGQWESLMVLSKFTKNQRSYIPSSVNDDEWLAAVLRPELIQKFYEETILQKKEIEILQSGTNLLTRPHGTKNKQFNGTTECSASGNLEDCNDSKNAQAETLREMNLNVFIPRLRVPFDNVPGLSFQWKKDEDNVREASNYLWNIVLPSLTTDIRKSQNLQLPMDGRSLTQFIHERGINCRYLGRLATLALQEEIKDKLEATEVNFGHRSSIERMRMPLSWLELLECEIVARSSKHVLDRYLSESLSVTGIQPLVVMSSFLSAIMSTTEEGAADTENRLYRDTISLSDTGIPMTLFFGDGDKNDGSSSTDILLRSRNQIWDDINHEIGRRFRYTLTLYNSKIDTMRSRALMIPLLRRLCQRMGIRLYAKSFQVGDKCFCGGSLNNVLANTRLLFPISPLDIMNISPMIKHAGFQHGESFIPYVPGSGAVSSCLHIILPDAKSALDSAQAHLQSKALPAALEASQEASSLYQRIVESPLHVNIATCLETTAVILFEAQEFDIACVTATKALALLAQVWGLDSPEVVAMHVTTFHIFYSVGEYAKCVQHLRAAIYLLELLCGPHSVEMANLYQRLGVLYYEKGQLLTALRLYQEATTRSCRDLVLEGVMVKTCANICASLSIFKAALEMEKRAYTLFVRTLGLDHELTKTSGIALEHFMTMAVAQGNRQTEEMKRRIETEAAETIANQIKADLDAEENIQKNTNGSEAKKKKKSKKP